jgi:glycosyltransferase involved in cell wall biosynthesis
MKVAHVITNLDTGGAQMMLRRLVMRLQAQGVENTVVTLEGDADPDDLARQGVVVHHLRMTSPLQALSAGRRLVRVLRRAGPDVVHTWLYHADLVGGLAARLARAAPVVWGLHHVVDDGDRLKTGTRLVMRVNGWLSNVVPVRIICCAQATRASHARVGYVDERMVVITNGIDTDLFRPDVAARSAVRREFGLPPNAAVVGLFARFHPQKDHRTFLAAAARLTAQWPAVHFLLAGQEVDEQNRALQGHIRDLGLTGCCHLLGRRHDVPGLMAACDVISLSSRSGEAFPLVLGEAMACAVPCVTTDVGDSARLVADTGRIVPAEDPAALAAAWAGILGLSSEERSRLGQAARERICTAHDLAKCVDAHLEVYEAARSGGPSPLDRP